MKFYALALAETVAYIAAAWALTGSHFAAGVFLAILGFLLVLAGYEAACEEERELRRDAVAAAERATAAWDGATDLRRDVLRWWADDCRATGRPIPPTLATLLEHDADDAETEQAKAQLRERLER